MIQYQEELVSNILKIAPMSGRCYIQKIYSSARLISFSVRFKGESRCLYLGRGHGVEGLWVEKMKITRELRQIDFFLEYLRKHLCSTELLKVVPIFNDRCVNITYKKYGEENSFIFLWKGRKLYFLHYFFNKKSNEFHLLKSWEGQSAIYKKTPIETLSKYLFEIGLSKEFTGSWRKSKTSAEQALHNEMTSLVLLNNSNKKLKFFERKVEKIKKDIETVDNVSELQNILIENHEDWVNKNSKVKGNRVQFIFKGLKVSLDANMSIFDKRDKIFRKIKSYKKARQMLEVRLKDMGNQIFELKNGHLRKFDKKLRITKVYWMLPQKENFKDKSKTISKYHIEQFETLSGFSFAIGRDAISNDFLRSKWGKKTSLWFHIDGYIGSHLVVKSDNIGNIDKDSLRVIASSLRDCSQLSLEEVPVIFTQLKNIKGVKGKKGAVLYRGEKYMKISYDKEWKEKVKK